MFELIGRKAGTGNRQIPWKVMFLEMCDPPGVKQGGNEACGLGIFWQLHGAGGSVSSREFYVF